MLIYFYKIFKEHLTKISKKMDQPNLIEVDPFKNLCKIFIIYELDTTPITLSLIKIKCLCLKLLIRFTI